MSLTKACIAIFCIKILIKMTTEIDNAYILLQIKDQRHLRFAAILGKVKVSKNLVIMMMMLTEKHLQR